MSKLKRAFQMLAAKRPQREICEELHMGRGVLAGYKKQADSKGMDYGALGRMSEDTVSQLLSSKPPTAGTAVISVKKKALDELLPDYAGELSHDHHLTVLRLHEEYLKDNPEGYHYTQFKKAVRDYQYAHNLSFHNEYIPGEELQIDFAGDPLYITDRKARVATRTKVVLLCCVLPYSGLGYAKAMYDATMDHFFSGISDAFTYMGGTTRIAKSDNMKQWVKKYDRYEPTFNDAAVEWSAYYDTSLETCRVKSPRDKGPVESIVNKFYQFIYASIRKETFYTLDELNSRILELVDTFNSRPSPSSGKSRLDVFKAEEQCALHPLPKSPYRFRYRKEVKLTGNYHVQVGKEQHKYSVPYQYVGRELIVVWDTDTVEVYCGMQRIALHTRRFTCGYSTEEAHMPPNHLEYKYSKGYNAAYFREQADGIGCHTRSAVDKILAAPKYVEHAYRSCQGILSLKRKYGGERLENACRRLSGCGAVTYMMIKNVLLRNLDREEPVEIVAKAPDNNYVRGADAFKI